MSELLLKAESMIYLESVFQHYCPVWHNAVFYLEGKDSCCESNDFGVDEVNLTNHLSCKIGADSEQGS
jgi:hypothetical protein